MVNLEFEEGGEDLDKRGRGSRKKEYSPRSGEWQKNWGKITKVLIKEICAERDDLYDTPHLNTKLFFNCQGLKEISGLEEWGQLQNLWLSSNRISQIRGLDSLSNLHCLFLEKNDITKIEGLDSLVNLVHLNLSENEITKIEGLGNLKSLNTLELQKNDITDISGLTECPSIGVLSLIGNDIKDDQDLLGVLEALPNLHVFYGKGNPVISSVKQYRKKAISRLKCINFLDNRPVMDVERAMAIAWAKGGKEAEKKAKADFHAEKAEFDQRNMDAWQHQRDVNAKQSADEKQNESERAWSPYATYTTVDDPLYADEREEKEQTRQQTCQLTLEDDDSEDDVAVPELEDMAHMLQPTQPKGEQEEKGPVTIDWREWDDLLLLACDEHLFDFGQVSHELNKQTPDVAFDRNSVRKRYAALDQVNWSVDMFF